MKALLKAGTRLQSVACETQIMIVKAGVGEIELCCGGHPMVDAAAGVDSVNLNPDFSQGTLVGKRYVDASESVEFLCIRGGAGSLSIDGIILGPKEARALPSSD